MLFSITPDLSFIQQVLNALAVTYFLRLMEDFSFTVSGPREE
jgi:hypothetical protein